MQRVTYKCGVVLYGRVVRYRCVYWGGGDEERQATCAPDSSEGVFMLSDVFHGTVMRIQQNHGGS